MSGNFRHAVSLGHIDISCRKDKYLRFYPRIEILIVPMLSYPGCHKCALFIGCIGTQVHGRQVTSLICLTDVSMSFHISAYSGTSGSLFLNINAVYNCEQEK